MSKIDSRPLSIIQNVINRILKVFLNILLYFLAITYIFPFVWMLYTSFKSKGEFTVSIFNLPVKPTLSNYQEIVKSGVFSAFFNSAYNTVLSIVFIVLLSFIISYFLSRYNFKGKQFFDKFFFIGMFLPITSLLIPVYMQFHTLGLTDRPLVLLIPYVTLNLPVSIYLYQSYLSSIPRAIDEAAFIDGANKNQIMTKVIFPICMPITGVILVLNGMSVWNEFPFALVLASADNVKTFPVWLTSFDSEFTSETTRKITAMLIACLPIIVLFVAFREKIMTGMAAGAIKG